MKKSTVLFLFFVLFTIAANAQVKFTNYTCPNNVKCIEVDGDIFWVGTTGGLYKWHKNGTLLAKYDSQNGLVGNNVNCLKMDYISGGLWIGTTHGVSKLVGTTWTSYTESDGLVDKNVNVISIDPLGHQWFGTNSGISEFDGTTWTTYDESNGLVGPYVLSIAFDSEGNKWFGTMGYGLSKYDGTTWTTYNTGNGLAGDYVYAIVIDLTGNKWFGTDGGVSKFDGTTWTTYNTGNGLAGQYVRAIAIDPSGNKWFGTNTGVSKFDGTSWTTYTTANGLTHDYINSIIVDASNNKWFGAWYGVTKFDGTTWTPYVTGMGLKDNNVKAVVFDNLGNKWFGTAEGVSKFDGTNWTAYTTLNGLADNSVNAIAVDAFNNKWFGTWSGISKFNGTTWTTYTTANGLVSNTVNSLAFDHIGNLWVGTWQGLSKFDGTTWTNYHTSDGLVSDNIRVVKIDSNNNIWIGAWGGISMFDGTTWTSYTNGNSNLPGDDIRGISFDTLGNMWSVSYGSCASMFNGSNFIYFSTPSNYTHAVTADSLGNIWIGSDAGLTRYDGVNQVTYSVSDGLVGVPVSVIAIDSQNNKWIGTWNGASKIYCEAPVVNFVTDTVCLSQATTFNNLTTKNDVFTDYIWDINNDGSVEYANENITHIFPAYGTFSVKLTASNGNCSSSIVKTVKVNSTPDVSLSHTGNLSICSGNPVTINALINNYDAGITYSYLWSTGANTSQIVAASSGTYSVTVSNAACHGAANAPLNLNVQSVNQNQELCLVTVDSTSTNNLIIWEKPIDPSIYSFLIYRDTANNNFGLIGEVLYDSLSLFIDTARHIYAANGDPNFSSWRYKIAVKDTCEHVSNLSSYHQSIFLQNNSGNFNWSQYQIEGQSLPVPSLTNYLFQRDNLSDGNYITIATLSASSTLFTDPQYATYQNTATWRVTTAWSISCTPTKAGGHNSTRSNVQRNFITNSPLTNNHLNLKISPNPTSGKFTVEIPDLITTCQLSITNLQGKVIYRTTLTNSKTEFDLSDKAGGVYFINVNSGEKVYHQKLVKE